MHSLVTGGGGFLGRYILDALIAQGDRVRSLGRASYPELEEAGVEVLRGDLRDPIAIAQACQGIECVFHVAAQPGIGLQRNPFETINQTGTELLLAAARRAGVARFVYTSSPSVVFAGKDQCGIDESTPYDFAWMEEHRAYYSLSKARAEQAVLAADCDTFRTCALRPHLIWGPRDSHLIPRLLARARAGRLRRVGDGTNRIDITYVENAATAHLQAARALAEPLAAAPSRVSFDSPAAPRGRAYFLSQAEPVNCWQWINELLALANLPPVAKSLSRKTARRIGTVAEWVYRTLRLTREPPMTRFLADQLATSHWYRVDAAQHDFGYTPTVSTAEGMKRLAAWIQQGGIARNS
ncbi:MAG: NAD-dependent epimerase/dehydratase family protein [Pirellulales bacterium]|nr:NAD-dependent epimerase/dehydratase family protein [Pirellulales bacterium]